MFLFQHYIFSSIIHYFFVALMVLLWVRIILTWFRLSDSNPIVLFLARCTDPIIVPIRKRIPPVGFLDISWIFAFVALIIMQMVLLQALPSGW
jgi:YggT family protein